MPGTTEALAVRARRVGLLSRLRVPRRLSVSPLLPAVATREHLHQAPLGEGAHITRGDAAGFNVAEVVVVVDTVGDDYKARHLKAYWTRGKGLALWAGSPHPWTTLVALLSKYMSPPQAQGLASNYFHEVFGIWPGERKGSNPVGPG